MSKNQYKTNNNYKNCGFLLMNNCRLNKNIFIKSKKKEYCIY